MAYGSEKQEWSVYPIEHRFARRRAVCSRHRWRLIRRDQPIRVVREFAQSDSAGIRRALGVGWYSRNFDRTLTINAAAMVALACASNGSVMNSKSSTQADA